MLLEKGPWSDSLGALVHGRGFYDQFDSDFWENKYRWCFDGDGGDGGDGGDESEATSQESQDEQSANEASAAADAAATAEAESMQAGFMGWGVPGGLPGPAETEDSFGYIGEPDPETGFVDPAGFAIDQHGNTVAPNSPEVDGFLSAALNSLTDPVGIATLAFGIPGIAGYGISKGLEAVGLGIPSIANMVGLTENSKGLADLGLNAAQNAVTDLGISTPDLGLTDTLDSVTSGIAGLGLSGPAQSGIDATGFSGNSGGTGIAGFNAAPMGLSSLAPGTSLAVADTTNLNDVTPSWSPANFQRYSGVGGFTPQAGIGALAANSHLYKNYMENT